MAELREQLLQIMERQWGYCHECQWWNVGAGNCYAYEVMRVSGEQMECPLLQAILDATAIALEYQPIVGSMDCANWLRTQAQKEGE